MRTCNYPGCNKENPEWLVNWNSEGPSKDYCSLHIIHYMTEGASAEDIISIERIKYSDTKLLCCKTNCKHYALFKFHYIDLVSHKLFCMNHCAEELSYNTVKIHSIEKV